MATAANIQVTANTQQAAGAFNNLANAIANANQQASQFGRTLGGLQAPASRAAGASDMIGGSFERMISLANNLTDVLAKVASAVEFVFDSIVKELDKIQGFNAIMTVSSKSADQAAASYDFLRQTADRMGVQFDSLLANYSKLSAAVPEGVDKWNLVNKVFLGVAEAARTLHSSAQDTQLMFLAIEQMASKGTVSMEELRRQLAQRIPGAMEIAANSVNTNVSKFTAAVKAGSVDSIKFLDAFGSELVAVFGDSSEKAATSVSAAMNRLTNVWTDFVKSVLDSGAGNAIIGIFDELRKKLSDPYVIARFATLIETLATQVTGFIQNLTTEDIRNGFDSFAHFMSTSIELIGKLIEGLQWIINNAGKAGAILGGVGGALAGATVAGPWGALIGGAVGTVGGAYAGSQMQPTGDELGQRKFEDAMASQKADELVRKHQELMAQLIPLLSNFTALKNLEDGGIGKLWDMNRLTEQEIKDIKGLLARQNVSPAQNAKDLLTYANTGLMPTSNPPKTLQDILNGKQKQTAEERSLNATYEKAFGLNPDYPKQLDNLNTLLKSGRLNIDQYGEALRKLVSEQPVEVAAAREVAKAQAEQNKQLEQNISMAFQQVEVKEHVRDQLNDEIKLIGLRTEDSQALQEALKFENEYNRVGLDVSKEQLATWTEQIKAKNKLKELSAIGNQILGATVDRYQPQIDQQKAMAGMLDKNSPLYKPEFTKQDRTDFTVQQDPNMAGSEQYFEAQKKQLEDYYTWIDGLRKQDVINEQTAEQAKFQAYTQYSEARILQADSVFSTLATLSESKNKELSMIGKRAALVDATIQGYLAIQRAIAAPPGWPYNAANVVAVGVVQAANVAAIASTAGFQTGGFTGNGPIDEPAGVVHGQEFVVNASATAKNRALLESLNRGERPNINTNSASNGSSRRNVSVEVHNYGTPQTYKVDEMTPEKVRLIAEDAVTRNAPRVVGRDMYNPNGQVSKAMRANTLTPRRRSQ